MDKLIHTYNVLKWFDIKKNVGKIIYLDEETLKNQGWEMQQVWSCVYWGIVCDVSQTEAGGR